MSTTSAPSPRGSTEKERRAGVGDEAAAGATGEESAKTAAGSAPAEEEERKIDVVMESEVRRTVSSKHMRVLMSVRNVLLSHFMTRIILWEILFAGCFLNSQTWSSVVTACLTPLN